MTLDSFKLKVVRYLFKINVRIGRKLAFLGAKYTAGTEIGKVSNKAEMEFNNMKKRMSAIIIKDQDIIDRRWAECEKCEHLSKNTKQCGICKCFMKLKTKVATARCPLDPPKWDKEYDFIKGQPTNGTQPLLK